MTKSFSGMPRKALIEKHNALWSDDSPRDYSERVDVPLFHGTRSHQSTQSIRNQGLNTWNSEEEGPKEIEEALKYFGKDKLLKSRGYKGGLVRDMVREIKRPGRRKVWATTNPDSPTWWSMSSPEAVHLSLLYAGVSPKDITPYMDKRFGKRYRIRLKTKPTRDQLLSNPANICTGMSCIKASDIDLVQSLPEDRILNEYRNRGWIKLSDLSKEKRGVLKHLDLEYRGKSLDFWGLKFRNFGSKRYFKVD